MQHRERPAKGAGNDGIDRATAAAEDVNLGWGYGTDRAKKRKRGIGVPPSHEEVGRSPTLLIGYAGT